MPQEFLLFSAFAAKKNITSLLIKHIIIINFPFSILN